MGEQQVITREETEWYNRLHEQEQIILEARSDELTAREAQIRAVWEVVTQGLYKPYHRRNEQPDMDHDDNLQEWLGTLQADGIPVVAYSTWRRMYETIVVALHEGMSQDRAFKLAAKSPDAVPRLRAADAISVKAEDGTQFLTTGKPVVVEHAENFDKLGVDTTGEYLEKLTDMPTGRHVSDAIRTDMGVPNVNVKSMWEGDQLSDVKLRKWIGEVEVSDSQGMTPYQFVLMVEEAMPQSALKQFIRKISQRFAHLASGKGN